MHRRLRLTTTGTITAALFALAACSGESSPSSQDGSELVVAWGRDVQTLNADTVSTNREGWETLNLIAEPLLTPDRDGKPVPAVGQSYKVSADHLTTSFRIRDGIKFSNGDPVTSADVKFTFENAQKGALRGDVYKKIVDIKTPDERTVELTTKTPDSGLLYDIDAYPVAIIPNDFAGMPADEFWKAPIGTGPFMVKAWATGGDLTLVPNPEYRAAAPAIKRLVFRPVPDENTRMLQLQNGDADIALDPPVAQLAALKGNDALQVLEFEAPESVYLSTNTTKAPFNDVHARRAVSLAINRDDVIQAAVHGHGKPVGSFIPRGALDGWTPPFGIEQDIEAARAELAKSATPDGFEFQLMYNSSGSNVAAAMQVIQAQLSKIGVTVKLAGLDPNALQDKLGAGDWNATSGSIINWADAGIAVKYYGSTNGLKSGSDLAALTETAWSKAQGDFTEGGRLAIFREVAGAIADAAPQIGLYSPTRLYGVRAGVKIDAGDPNNALDYAKATVGQ